MSDTRLVRKFPSDATNINSGEGNNFSSQSLELHPIDGLRYFIYSLKSNVLLSLGPLAIQSSIFSTACLVWLWVDKILDTALPVHGYLLWSNQPVLAVLPVRISIINFEFPSISVFWIPSAIQSLIPLNRASISAWLLVGLSKIFTKRFCNFSFFVLEYTAYLWGLCCSIKIKFYPAIPRRSPCVLDNIYLLIGLCL